MGLKIFSAITSNSQHQQQISANISNYQSPQQKHQQIPANIRTNSNHQQQQQNHQQTSATLSTNSTTSANIRNHQQKMAPSAPSRASSAPPLVPETPLPFAHPLLSLLQMSPICPFLLLSFSFAGYLESRPP